MVGAKKGVRMVDRNEEIRKMLAEIHYTQNAFFDARDPLRGGER
jgi:hypothetical protein